MNGISKPSLTCRHLDQSTRVEQGHGKVGASLDQEGAGTAAPALEEIEPDQSARRIEAIAGSSRGQVPTCHPELESPENQRCQFFRKSTEKILRLDPSGLVETGNPGLLSYRKLPTYQAPHPSTLVTVGIFVRGSSSLGTQLNSTRPIRALPPINA